VALTINHNFKQTCISNSQIRISCWYLHFTLYSCKELDDMKPEQIVDFIWIRNSLLKILQGWNSLLRV